VYQFDRWNVDGVYTETNDLEITKISSDKSVVAEFVSLDLHIDNTISAPTDVVVEREYGSLLVRWSPPVLAVILVITLNILSANASGQTDRILLCARPVEKWQDLR
jgi:hypothetical protein